RDLPDAAEVATITFRPALAWLAVAAWCDQGARMPRAASALISASGTHGGQGTSRPGRPGMCSTWTGRPAPEAPSRMRSARLSGEPGPGSAEHTGGPGRLGGVMVDTGFQCVIRWGMLEGV